MDSKIEWKKPLQLAKGLYATPPYPVTVLERDGGNRLISWKAKAGIGHAIVSEYGNLIATLHNGAASGLGTNQFVENVPEAVKVEPPKDTLIMYRPRPHDSWYLMFDGAMSRKEAEAKAAVDAGPCDCEIKYVTVPDDSKLVQSIAQPAKVDPHEDLRIAISIQRGYARTSNGVMKRWLTKVADAAESVLAEAQAAKAATPAFKWGMTP